MAKWGPQQLGKLCFGDQVELIDYIAGVGKQRRCTLRSRTSAVC